MFFHVLYKVHDNDPYHYKATLSQEIIMIRLYFHTAPNPKKVVLFLEETGLPYELIPIDINKGEQHTTEFLKVNPNAKVPIVLRI